MQLHSVLLKAVHSFEKKNIPYPIYSLLYSLKISTSIINERIRKNHDILLCPGEKVVNHLDFHKSHLQCF